MNGRMESSEINDISCFISENSSKSDRRDLLIELEMLKKLKPHPNVIRFKGCVTKSNIRCGKHIFSKFAIFR